MRAKEAPVFPFASADPLEPPAEYASLRASEPVSAITLPSGDRAWLVTRYEDVRAILADPRFSREAITSPGAPQLLPIAQGSKSIFVMDPPEHSRLRRLISKAFSPRRITGLRPQIEVIANRLADGMLASGPPADLIKGFAQPLPISLICELLGVPYDDVPSFCAWTDVMLSFRADARDEVLAARDRLSEYLAALIERKKQQPAGDLLTALIAAREEDDKLSEDELLAFGYTLLGAGYHATTAQIINAVLTLARHPGELRALRECPALLPGAVEELLRLSQAGGGLGALRIAIEDVRVGNVLVQAGDAVLPSINSANRDVQVFADADRLDLSRSPNPHIAFGYGIHHCVGAQLGRIELEVALSCLLARLPEWQLAVPEDALEWNQFIAFRRPAELPLDWRTGQ